MPRTHYVILAHENPNTGSRTSKIVKRTSRSGTCSGRPGWLGKRARRCGQMHASQLPEVLLQVTYVDRPGWLENRARNCGRLRVS